MRPSWSIGTARRRSSGGPRSLPPSTPAGSGSPWSARPRLTTSSEATDAMGLISGLLTLPLAPVRGVVWLGEQLESEARKQWSDPAAVRRELAAVEAAFEAGELTEAERDEREDALVARLMEAGAGGPL